MTTKHLAYLLAFACFTGVAACILIGKLGRQWPRSNLRSFHTLKRPEFTLLGWRLRNAAVGFSYLGCAFGLASCLS